MESNATGKPLVKQNTAMVKPLPVRASYPDRHPGGGPQPGQYKTVSCFNPNHLGGGPHGGEFAPRANGSKAYGEAAFRAQHASEEGARANSRHAHTEAAKAHLEAAKHATHDDRAKNEHLDKAQEHIHRIRTGPGGNTDALQRHHDKLRHAQPARSGKTIIPG